MRKNKRLRAALLICGGVILAAVLIVVLLNLLLPEDTPAQPPENAASFTFYPPYDGDIRIYDGYLDLNRQFIYCDRNYGTEEAMLPEEIEANPEWRALQRYFDCLIDGDPDGLRALLTEEALKRITVPDFAQQMIYELRVTRIGETQEGGALRVTYRLAYSIFRNNGTYRRDVGSDSPRPEYLTLTQEENGEFRISDIQR